MDKSPEEIDKKLHDLILFPNQELGGSVIKGYDFNQGVDYS